jgi:hypothetical protein
MHAKTMAGWMGHGVHEAAYQMPGPWGELRVFSPARIDRERFASSDSRHVVGKQTGGVHDGGGFDSLARRDHRQAGITLRFDRNDWSAAENDGAQPLSLAGQLADIGLGLEPAGLGRPERGDARNVRLTLPETVGVELLEADAIRSGRACDRLELGFLSRCRDDHLSAPRVGHIELPAERVDPLAALVAQERLQ